MRGLSVAPARALGALLFMLGPLDACRDAAAPTSDPLAIIRIQLSADSLRLAAGATVRVTGLPIAANGRPRGDVPVAWSTNDASVATVAGDGMIEAMGVGSAIITARAGSCTAPVRVTVVAPGGVVQLRVEPAALSLTTGESELVNAYATDADGNPVYAPPIAWRSTDTSIARVDVAGRVEARAPGAVRIVAAAGVVEGDIQLTVADGAGIPTLEGQWLMAALDGRALPTAYRVFLDVDVGGRIVRRVEIRVDSATKVVRTDGTYQRGYYFSEWHDGVRAFVYRWGDRGRYTLRRADGATTAIRMVSEWIQNLETRGVAEDAEIRLDESVWTGEAPEKTVWHRRP